MIIKNCNLIKVVSCDKKEGIVDVAKKLKRNKVRHIIVTDNNKPMGLISTTDINNRVVAMNKDLKKTKAEDVMTSPILTKDANDSLPQAYMEMIKANVFSCPITKNNKLIGVLDLKEAMNCIVKNSPSK